MDRTVGTADLLELKKAHPVTVSHRVSGLDCCRSRHGQCYKPGEEKLPSRMTKAAQGQNPGQIHHRAQGHKVGSNLRVSERRNQVA